MPVLIVVAVLGAILLAVGLRGRRVGSDPHCRRCGYCLAGLEARNCPECEAPVWDPAYRVVGQRRRRGRLVWAGLVMLLFGASAAVGVRVLAPPGANPYAWMPDWLLVMQEPGSPESAGWLRIEIASRLQRDDLSEEHRQLLAARARRVVGRTSWSNNGRAQAVAAEWAIVYGALWRLGDVDDAEMQALLDQSVMVEVDVVRRVGLSDAYFLRMDMWGALTGPAAGLYTGHQHWVLVNGSAQMIDQGHSGVGGGEAPTSSCSVHTGAEAIRAPMRVEIPRLIDLGQGAEPRYRTWMIVVEVPGFDEGDALLGEVRVTHSFVDGDVMAEALVERGRRMDAEFFRRLDQREKMRDSGPEVPEAGPG